MLKLLAFICVLLFPAFVCANSLSDFLLSNLDARDHALGSSFIADQNGAGFGRNPVALLNTEGTNLSSTVGIRPQGTKMIQINFSRPLNHHLFGLNWYQTFYPEQNFVDDEGNVSGGFKNSDSALTIVHAREWNGLRCGVSGTWMRKKIAGLSSSAFSATLAIQYPLHRRFVIGISADDLPIAAFDFESKENSYMQFRGGAMIKALDRDNLSFNLLIDGFASGQNDPNFNLGLEIQLNHALFIRGGVSPGSESGRLGLGFRLEKMRFDWSMQFSPLGSKDFMNATIGYQFK